MIDGGRGWFELEKIPKLVLKILVSGHGGVSFYVPDVFYGPEYASWKLYVANYELSLEFGDQKLVDNFGVLRYSECCNLLSSRLRLFQV